MERTSSLSINSVRRYKVATMALLSVIALAFSISHLLRFDAFGIIIGIGYPLLLIFAWYPQTAKFLKKLKEVSYDKENLYVKEGDYEIQIPFWGIKDIELISFDGLYQFKLYQSDQFGKEVLCKPSLWYPLNYKKIDKELNRVRGLVRKAHRNYKEQIGNDRSLASFN